MKKFLLSLFCIFALFSFVGCQDAEVPEADQESIENQDQSHKQDSTKVDSVAAELKGKVESLSTQADSVKTKLEAQAKEITDIKNSKTWLIDGILSIFGIVGLIMALIANSKAQKALEKIKEYRDKINIADQIIKQSNSNSTRRVQSSSGNYVSQMEFKELQNEVLRIKKDISKVEPNPEATVSSLKQTDKQKPSDKDHAHAQGYVGDIIGDEKMYFNDFSHAHFLNANFILFDITKDTASFRPIELKNIKNDNCRKAAKFEGDCSLEDAQDMEIRKPGKLKRIGDLWFIDEPIHIYLKK